MEIAKSGCRQQKSKSACPLVFLDLTKSYEILENNGPLRGLFKPHPPDCRSAERDNDLLVLALGFAALADLGAPPVEAACRVGCAT